MLRSLYRLVPTAAVKDILKSGLKPSHEFTNGVFMFSMKDLKYWNKCSVVSTEKSSPNLLQSLIEQVCSHCGPDMTLLKINVRGMNFDRLRIREQKILLNDIHACEVFCNNVKLDPAKFEKYVSDYMKRTNCGKEKAEEVVRGAYSELELSHYAIKGEPISRAAVHTNNKKAIEYVYQSEINPELIEVVGQCYATEDKSLYRIFSDLTKGKKEANHLWQLA